MLPLATEVLNQARVRFALERGLIRYYAKARLTDGRQVTILLDPELAMAGVAPVEEVDGRRPADQHERRRR